MGSFSDQGTRDADGSFSATSVARLLIADSRKIDRSILIALKARKFQSVLQKFLKKSEEWDFPPSPWEIAVCDCSIAYGGSANII
jgi:hypothetical protein